MKWAAGGAFAVVASGAAGVELVANDVVPGHQVLNELDGTCSVASPSLQFAPLGPTTAGQFFSNARRRVVGYEIAYPPGHRPGSELPLVVALHAYGGDHTRALPGLTPAQALAGYPVHGQPVPPVALVAADGGGGYWHAHPGDDPMGMVVDELIPMCRGLGLGTVRVGALVVSMGGYGALLLAEKHPDLVDAVAAISPAVWTSYVQARAANPGAFGSGRDFAANDVIAGAAALRAMPVRVVSGRSDPFHPGVSALAGHLTPGTVEVSKGCHTGPFFAAQLPPSLDFLAAHLQARAAT